MRTMSSRPQFVYYICPFCGGQITAEWPGVKVGNPNGDLEKLILTISAETHMCPSGKSHYEIMKTIALDQYEQILKMMRGDTDDTATR